MKESESERSRRRWITVGELIAIAALIVSALGVWISWKNSGPDGPAEVIEQRQPIPLTLRGQREDDGRRLEISPVEPAHALQSLTVTIPGASAIQVGSDGELDSNAVESALGDRGKEPRNQTLAVRVRIDTRYVEMGKDRRSTGTYTLRYMWKGGGLFGGRSLHLVGISR